LERHQLSGQHLTRAIPPTTLCIKETPRPLDHINGINGTSNFDTIKITKQNPEELATQKLFVFSASDERSLKRLVTTYQQNLPDLCKDAGSFADLAYTLSEKRTSLLWRFFSQASSTQELQQGLEIEHSKLVRSTQGPKLCFVFTGQGAQWNNMGRELLEYPVFRRSLQESELCFKDMGSSWSLIGTDSFLKAMQEFQLTVDR
jgi:acyl transferase domain-containing protein